MTQLMQMSRRERLGAIVCLGLAVVWAVGRFYNTALAFLIMSLLYFSSSTRISRLIDLALGVSTILIAIVYAILGKYVYALVYVLVFVSCIYKIVHARAGNKIEATESGNGADG